MIRTLGETRFSTKARLLDNTAGESGCVLEEARVFVAFLSLKSDLTMTKFVNRTETFFSVVQDSCDECRITLEAYAPSDLEETPILRSFVASLSQTQLTHLEDGHPILITSISPQAVGSEEVTFIPSGEGFIALYPPTNCCEKLHKYIEVRGGYYILLSERDTLIPEIPEVQALYDELFAEEYDGDDVPDVPHHDYRSAVCYWTE
jgi:hypothetical protein